MRLPTLTLACLALAAGCKHDSITGAETPLPDRPVTWVDGVWVQPVPSWGSSIRLDLPVPIDDINLTATGGLGFFGAHEGGHVEGLDHIWMPTFSSASGFTTTKSWAAGTVTRIENSGGFYFIDVDYGQGLVGKHQLCNQSLVAVGQKLNSGDPVCRAQLAEFNLVDNNRTDGVGTGSTRGVNVSPFDYLKPEIQQALITRLQGQVVPSFALGKTVGNSRPWEPWLTNKLLLHKDHRGTFQGEWILLNKGWSTPDPSYFDVMTIQDVTNQYGHFTPIDFEDSSNGPGSKGLQNGTWAPGDSAGKFTVTQAFSNTVRYARYTVDESGPRAKLTIEWRTGSYPPAITANAAVYIERDKVYLGLDTQRMGLTK